MSGPETQRRETQRRQIDQTEQAAKAELARLISAIEDLPPDAIDDDLLRALDRAQESAGQRVEEAKRANNGGSNGKPANQ